MLLRRKKKAYTLLEIVVVAVVTSVIFILGARWVFALTTAANAPLLNRSGTQITYALDKMENDLRLAKDCDPYGNGGAMQELNENAVSFTFDENNDGTIERVYWRLDGEALERAVITGSGCSFAAPGESDWSVLVTEVSGDPTLFLPVSAGQPVTFGDAFVCDSGACSADAVRVGVKSTSAKASTVRSIVLP